METNLFRIRIQYSPSSVLNETGITVQADLLDNFVRKQFRTLLFKVNGMLVLCTLDVRILEFGTTRLKP